MTRYNWDVKTIQLSEFKARCIRILEDVARTSEPVVVTPRRTPVARVEPVKRGCDDRELGGLKGYIRSRGDLVRSDLDHDWS